jgi:hypothetical protein
MLNEYTSKNLLAVLILGTVSIVLISVIVISYALGKDRERDDQTLCRRGPPPAHTVVLVDATDPLTPDQLRVVQGEIQRLGLQTLEEDQRLSIYRLEPKVKEGVQLLFSKCHPGDGSGASEVIENPGKLKQRYGEEFKQPFQVAVETIGNSGKAETRLFCRPSIISQIRKNSALTSSIAG